MLNNSQEGYVRRKKPKKKKKKKERPSTNQKEYLYEELCPLCISQEYTLLPHE